MKISGHKTHEMLKRYNIVSLKGVLDSGDKMDAWMKKSRIEHAKSKPTSSTKPRKKPAVAAEAV